MFGMLETLLHTFVNAHVGTVRRKAKGAVLEVAAFGMIGLSVGLLFVGLFLWLSIRMEPWLAAIVLSCLALLVAIILILVGRSLLKPKEIDPHEQAASALKALGLFSADGPKTEEKTGSTQDPGPAMVASALAAGLILGRSVRR